MRNFLELEISDQNGLLFFEKSYSSIYSSVHRGSGFYIRGGSRWALHQTWAHWWQENSGSIIINGYCILKQSVCVFKVTFSRGPWSWLHCCGKKALEPVDQICIPTLLHTEFPICVLISWNTMGEAEEDLSLCKSRIYYQSVCVTYRFQIAGSCVFIYTLRPGCVNSDVSVRGWRRGLLGIVPLMFPAWNIHYLQVISRVCILTKEWCFGLWQANTSGKSRLLSTVNCILLASSW